MGACANRGIGPQGGPKDDVPPEIREEIPANGSTNWKGQRITLVFNEYVQLDNVSKNVLISPPMPHMPEVKAVGKHVTVTFPDSLRDNTTYTIDFGSAICDYREKNPIHGYRFAFSTGDQIDTLEAHGHVYRADNLNPVAGAVVGIQDVLDDAAFETKQFTRVAKTDSAGHFIIQNIHEGTYRYYGLMDMSNDNRYQPGEALAYTDDTIHPYLWEEERLDTIWTDRYDTTWVDTLISRIDTLRVIERVDEYIDTWAEPGNLVLWLFEEKNTRLFLQRAERKERYRIDITFGGGQRRMPTIEADWMDRARIEASNRLDTVCIWLTDTLLVQNDSLEMRLTYERTDSAYSLETVTDTLLLTYREPRVSDKVREANEKMQRERKLLITSNASTKFQVYDTLRIHFDYPTREVLSDRIRLYEKKDTLFHEVGIQLIPMDSIGRSFGVIAELKPEGMYELRCDSACATDVFNHTCDQTRFAIKLKALSDYSSVRVKILSSLGDYEGDVVVELLNEKDKVIQSHKAEDGVVLFRYIEDKSCYLRCYEDANSDGQWTTGDWAKKRQPERVFYYPKKLSMKANWDFEEVFDYTERPQLESKPKALVKIWNGTKK